MSYRVEILKGALKQLKKLSPELQERIQVKIDDLATEPRPSGVKKLKGQENAYRIRVCEYRIIYDIFDIDINQCDRYYWRIEIDDRALYNSIFRHSHHARLQFESFLQHLR
ncbi:type II toxin-antitoxin system RelE family toxin [Scytonema hofmannii]|uniref:type II toxin-antitoxin system RelE family toxin n=1 Tax=Scytonema hofmannii TaxID=34078 RepID=UPI00034CC833